MMKFITKHPAILAMLVFALAALAFSLHSPALAQSATLTYSELVVEESLVDDIIAPNLLLVGFAAGMGAAITAYFAGIKIWNYFKLGTKQR